eukprot:scaffold33644_cov63-Phaeocystis_antarctica.AAC.2
MVRLVARLTVEEHHAAPHLHYVARDADHSLDLRGQRRRIGRRWQAPERRSFSWASTRGGLSLGPEGSRECPLSGLESSSEQLSGLLSGL